MRGRGNIFSNPYRWARSAVDTPFRYRCSQAMFVLFGLMIIVLFIDGSKQAPHDVGWWSDFGILCLLVFEGAILFPLTLLRAVRAWIPPADEPRGFEVIKP